MQANHNRKLIRMFVERIINETFPDETAASRLQQVGLFTLIYMLQGDKEPITASRLCRMTGLSDGQILTHLRKLIKIELVERIQILNRQGRGRAFHLSIKHNTKARRLVKAIEKGVGRKTRT